MQSDILPNENAAQDESAEPTGNRDVAREKCWGGANATKVPTASEILRDQAFQIGLKYD